MTPILTYFYYTLIINNIYNSTKTQPLLYFF
nr:MAG TPA: hypothetical protein [Caudoviricetes sp.]